MKIDFLCISLVVCNLSAVTFGCRRAEVTASARLDSKPWEFQIKVQNHGRSSVLIRPDDIPVWTQALSSERQGHWAPACESGVLRGIPGRSGRPALQADALGVSILKPGKMIRRTIYLDPDMRSCMEPGTYQLVFYIEYKSESDNTIHRLRTRAIIDRVRK